MAASGALPPTLEGYQLRLPVFAGPLDVLLRLIERDQLEISDVSLVSVFDQFMTYVHTIEAAPPHVIAEFAAVAGRLSVLKSRALLPKPSKIVEYADEPDLVRQLAEYRAVKAAADVLADRQREGLGAFGRGESIARPESVPDALAPLPSTALVRAVNRWLTRVPAKPALLTSRPVVTLRDMIARITATLDGQLAVPFGRICAACVGRQDVTIAFLALLVLMRRQVVHATQSETFGPITVTRVSRDHGLLSGPVLVHQAGEDVSG